ncbi:MAG: ankyrin repeat domain-containing protein, partial [Cyanobacteria bacterium]|nr:ankyrin repeat domain-containing protein [Cyanobacteriota bacterium]
AGENALVESVASGHLGMTKKLLSYGISAKEAIDRTGVSALSEALAHDNLDIADELLSHGAELQKKVQSETDKGSLPLMIYVVQRAQNAKTIEYLLQKGVSPLDSDEGDFTALHHAIRFEKYDMIKVLASENTLFSTTDRYNRTPMMYAAEEGDFKAFKILHKAGGSLDHFNSDGRTAMHFAVKAANKNVFKYLISHGVDPFVVDDHGVSPFHLAALHQNTEALEQLLTLHEPKPLDTLLNQEDHSGTTPLAYAARGKTVETLKFLHEKGASLACVDKQGTNLLHFASLGSSIEILDYLLDQGFDINQPNPEGETPIHYASNFGSEKVLEHLIKRGANLNTKDTIGLTPLDHAILEGNLKHTQKLQTYGATGDPLYQKLLDFQFKHPEWVENPKEAESLIQVIPHLILSKPLTTIERLSQNVELFFDNYPEKRGYHPNEAELMQFLKHPDLLDRDPEKTALISRALTSITQFIETETELKDSVLKAWGDIGLLTHAHRFWRFDTVSQIGEGRQETLFESFGFKPIENRSLDSALGKGYAYRDPESGVLFEFRRGYLLASHPDHNTLVIRNSSTVFGRDLMKHPAYLLPIEIQEKHLQNFDPRNLSCTQPVII